MRSANSTLASEVLKLQTALAMEREKLVGGEVAGRRLGRCQSTPRPPSTLHPPGVRTTRHAMTRVRAAWGAQEVAKVRLVEGAEERRDLEAKHSARLKEVARRLRSDHQAKQLGLQERLTGEAGERVATLEARCVPPLAGAWGRGCERRGGS